MPTTYHLDANDKTVFEVEEPFASDGSSDTRYIRRLTVTRLLGSRHRQHSVEAHGTKKETAAP